MRRATTAAVAATAMIGGLGLAALLGPASAGSAWQVGVHIKSDTVNLGQRVVLTGKVRPGGSAAGHKVELQEKYKPGRPWATKDTDKVNGTGHFTLAYRPTTNTQRKYRVVMPATKGHRQGVSRSIEVTVYGWGPLTAQTHVNAHGMSVRSTVMMNGVSYQHSVESHFAYGTSSIEFNLDHKCIKLKGTFGIGDDSETGSQATVAAESDGTQVYTGTFAVGQSSPAKLKLDSPLKLRLTSQSIVGGAPGYGAVGSPQVLCTK